MRRCVTGTWMCVIRCVSRRRRLSFVLLHTSLELHQSHSIVSRCFSRCTYWRRLPLAAPSPCTTPGPPARRQIRLFESASAQSPSDPELHVALGVLHHLGRQYGAAVAAFERALQLRPNDYSLWNKLGATLANNSRSAEALAAYQKVGGAGGLCEGNEV